MPRLRRLSGRNLARALEKGGFRLVRIHGDHAFMHNAETNRHTSVPLTRKTLPVGTIASILFQAGLTAEDLEDLVGS